MIESTVIRPIRQRLIILGAVLMLATLFAFARQPDPAVAHNDYCTTYSKGWYCIWTDPNLAPATPHWFQATVTLRNWNFAGVSDGHGGSVHQKCVHIKRGSDGYTEQVICGSGIKDDYIEPHMRPGYLFTRHGASGNRSITGDGAH